MRLRLCFLIIMFVLFGSAAHAACPGSLVLQDAVGTKAPARYTDDGSGNCMPNVILGPTTGAIGSVSLTANTATIGFVSNDVCAQSAKSNVAISAATATVQLVTGSSSKKVYVCSLSLITNGVVSVSLIEGTGPLCVTANEAAVIGSTVATQGLAFTTNGGLTLGNGGGTVGFTGTAANGLCLLQSLTTTIVSGNLTYTQQ